MPDVTDLFLKLILFWDTLYLLISNYQFYQIPIAYYKLPNEA